jgi:hypothetical protein
MFYAFLLTNQTLFLASNHSNALLWTVVQTIVMVAGDMYDGGNYLNTN